MSGLARIYRAEGGRSKIPADEATVPAPAGHLARSNPVAMRAFGLAPWRCLRCRTTPSARRWYGARLLHAH